MIRRLDSRIGRFCQIIVFSEAAIVVVIATAAAVTDLGGLSGLCVGRYGARILFYLLTAIEVLTVVQVVRFRASHLDLNAFEREAGSFRQHASKPRSIVAVAIFGACVFYGSAVLGYGEGGLCAGWPSRRIVVDYWYLLAVNLGRVICLMVVMYLALLPGPWRELK
jgi:hypothetical protein